MHEKTIYPTSARLYLIEELWSGGSFSDENGE